MIILGIDPGSRKTGVGVIEVVKSTQKIRMIEAYTIKLGAGPMPERLAALFDALQEILTKHTPDVMAIEAVFVQKNAATALKLGQARGVCICAVARTGIACEEYAPRRIKQAVVGVGSADKHQVGHMVKSLLQLPKAPQEDAADALAVALCHAHTQLGYTVANKKESWRNYDRKTLRETD